MKKVLVIGGGAAGCAAALDLTEAGIPVLMAEKAEHIGGKTAAYGCKAGERCTQCGVCLTGPLFEQAADRENLEILCGTRVFELIREEDGFTVFLDRNGETLTEEVGDILIASGFSHLPVGESGNLRFTGSPCHPDVGRSDPPAINSPDFSSGGGSDPRADASARTPSGGDAESGIFHSPRILYGEQLEAALRERTSSRVFEEAPARIGFVFCFGSRNPSHGVPYCSRVCCGYATRSAKALKHIYPDIQISMFFMDLQSVKAGNYLKEMREEGFEMIRCRPNRIEETKEGVDVWWEDHGGIHKKELDLCVLCSGIRPNEDNGLLAELTGLSVDGDGFLQTVLPPEETGVWVAGTAAGPMSIAESVADARAKAGQLARHRNREVSI